MRSRVMVSHLRSAPARRGAAKATNSPRLGACAHDELQRVGFRSVPLQQAALAPALGGKAPRASVWHPKLDQAQARCLLARTVTAHPLCNLHGLHRRLRNILQSKLRDHGESFNTSPGGQIELTISLDQQRLHQRSRRMDFHAAERLAVEGAEVRAVAGNQNIASEVHRRRQHGTVLLG